MKTVPLEMVTDASGNGLIQFTARKPAVIYTIHKISTVMPVITTGWVEVYKNGAFQSKMNIALRMEAYGPETLFTSEHIQVRMFAGPASTVIQFLFFYDESAGLP